MIMASQDEGLLKKVGDQIRGSLPKFGGTSLQYLKVLHLSC